MKYKAKETYKKLPKNEGFLSLGSASRHIKLMAGEIIEFTGNIPKKIKDCLTEIKIQKGDK